MNIATTNSGPGVNNHHHQQNQIVIPIVPPPVPPPMPPPPNLPRSDLLEGSREDYIKIGVPLYEASIIGNWKAAKPILDKQPELIRFAITENYETPLHIAASAESTKAVEEFVENLVNLMEKNDLELQNKSYNTALGLAAAAGNVKIAMIMVKKNRAVMEIPGSNRTMPLYVAALFAKPDMVRYLYHNSNEMSGDYWSHEIQGWLLQKCVESDIFDVATKIVNDRPELYAKKGLLTNVLFLLAQKTRAFKQRKPHILVRIIKSIFAVFHVKVRFTEKESEALQLLRILWKKIAIMPKSEIDDIIRGPPMEVKKQGDLAPSRRGTDIGSKTGVVLMVVSILLGLLCFVLCLIAEATRSQVIREASGSGGGEAHKSDCRYSGNGETPLICAAGAFVALVIAMVVQHTHLLLSVSKSDPDPSLLLTWDPLSNDHLNTLTWQAAFFFVTTWICFSVGEILLLIGLSVESGHLKGWSTPRSSCFTAREGLFSSAGVFGITTVFLASGLSMTALRAQWLLQDQENVRQEVMQSSILYASPPRPSEDRIMVIGGEAPIVRHDLYREPGLIEYLRAFDKIL